MHPKTYNDLEFPCPIGYIIKDYITEKRAIGGKGNTEAKRLREFSKTRLRPYSTGKDDWIHSAKRGQQTISDGLCGYRGCSGKSYGAEFLFDGSAAEAGTAGKFHFGKRLAVEKMTELAFTTRLPAIFDQMESF